MQPEESGAAAMCAKHFLQRAVGRCDDCGASFCGDCLVPPARKRQPTRCIDCALIAGGVRAPGPRYSGLGDIGRSHKR